MSSTVQPTPRDPGPVSPSELQQIGAQARYHRDRLALYRARLLSAHPTSPHRLRELEQISAAADARLRHARS
jgi:hypothetical protein